MSSTRQDVLAIARGWIGTPFVYGAAVKGVGVDCAQFVLQVYEEAGLIRDFAMPKYTPQIGLHQGAEIYLDGLAKVAREFPGPPQPADIAVFHLARIYWHAAIVIEWPTLVICAAQRLGVGYLDPSRDPAARKQWRKFPPRFFTFWPTP